MDVGYYLARLSFGKAVRQRSWKKLAAQTRHGLSLEGSLRQMYQRAEAQGSVCWRPCRCGQARCESAWTSTLRFPCTA